MWIPGMWIRGMWIPDMWIPGMWIPGKWISGMWNLTCGYLIRSVWIMGYIQTSGEVKCARLMSVLFICLTLNGI
jgi:hypothetical protein